VSGSVSRLIIVSGAPGSGKTSALERALAVLAGRGIRVRACLSYATERVAEGPALGFDLAFFENGADQGAELRETGRIELARRPPPEPGDSPVRDRLRPFVFAAEAFSRASAFFCAPAAEGGGAGRGVVAVDEIGPLELSEDGGFFPVLRAWREGSIQGVLIATVRPALARELAGKLGNPGARIVSLDACSIDDAAKLAAELAEAGCRETPPAVDSSAESGLGWRP
jgi:nucleoside-triphosphatase THEP1